MSIKRPCGMPYCSNEASYRTNAPQGSGYRSPEYVCGLHSVTGDERLTSDDQR